MIAIRKTLRTLGESQRGATAIEYGLIVALVSIVAIATLTVVGTKITGVFTSVSTKLHS